MSFKVCLLIVLTFTNCFASVTIIKRSYQTYFESFISLSILSVKCYYLTTIITLCIRVSLNIAYFSEFHTKQNNTTMLKRASDFRIYNHTAAKNLIFTLDLVM